MHKSYSEGGLDGCVYQMHIKDKKARSNAYWRCIGIRDFYTDCTTTLPSQDSDKKDKSPDTSPTIGCVSHTLTAAMPRTDFTFKVIWKELVS